MRLVDSHCHLDMLDLTPDDGDLNRVLDRAKEMGVCHFLNVCVSLADYPAVMKIAEAYPFVSASFGVHPNEKEEGVDEAMIVHHGSHPKVIAIGETGLDYYRSTGDLEWQRDRFRAHIRAAKQLRKPLIIHSRDAKEDTLRLMSEEHAEEIGGVMHCFSEDWGAAQEALNMNFYISFSGVVTFKNALVLKDVAKLVPLDRILVETDSPYLAPMPKRGKPNEPGYVRYTADYIAELRGMDPETFAEQTTKNFFTLFSGAAKTNV